MKSHQELVLFAERVERLCKHLRERMSPGTDRDAIDRLADDAAKISVNDDFEADTVLDGIAEALR